MKPSPKFDVTITGTHGVIVPDAYAKPFFDAGHSRVALIASYHGKKLSFHGKLHKYNGQVLISFGKRYQKEIGITANDTFSLQIFEDTTKYGVEMSEAFSAVLETDIEAFQLFENLSMGKKRSLIYYISRFKSEQTQVDKALLICENLKMGIVDTKLLVKQNR